MKSVKSQQFVSEYTNPSFGTHRFHPYLHTLYIYIYIYNTLMRRIHSVTKCVYSGHAARVNNIIKECVFASKGEKAHPATATHSYTTDLWLRYAARFVHAHPPPNFNILLLCLEHIRGA